MKQSSLFKNPFIKKNLVKKQISFSSADIIHIKRKYLQLSSRYLASGIEEVGKQASVYQSLLQRSIPAADYRTFIKSAIPYFRRGKVKSKSILTLLNSLDKQTRNEYTSISDKRNPAIRPGSIAKYNKASKLFKEFHHYAADKVKHVKINAGRGSIKLDMMHLGTMPDMKYISDKDINETGSRKKYRYVHGLKKHLDIYADADKQMLIIPLDGQDIIGRGLISKPGKKVQIKD